jgi:hypothetical protein
LLALELLGKHEGFAAHLWKGSPSTCGQQEDPDWGSGGVLSNWLFSLSFTCMPTLTHYLQLSLSLSLSFSFSLSHTHTHSHLQCIPLQDKCTQIY